MTKTERAGTLLCVAAASMACLFVLYMAMGILTGFLQADVRYWPFMVGIPAALLLGFVMPLLGGVGAFMVRGLGCRWIAGAAPVALAAILWTLLVTAPAPGI